MFSSTHAFRICIFILVSGSLFAETDVTSENEQKLLPGFEKMLFNALGGSITPSQGELKSRYDSVAVPMNIDKNSVFGALAKNSSSIFFLQFSAGEYVNLEADKFIIPNGDYGEFNIEWSALFDASGRNIIREPTNEETANFKRANQPDWSRIYHESKGKPTWAKGQMQAKIPILFALIELTPEKVGMSLKAEGTEICAELQRCENDVACVNVSGNFEGIKPLIIFCDATGRRLKTGESASGWSPKRLSLTCRAQGAIAQVLVYYPVKFATKTLAIEATARPLSFGEDAWAVRAPRYSADMEGADFKEIDSETIKHQTVIEARRSYAILGFNDPQIAVLLPDINNSRFAEVKLKDLQLFDAAGKQVKFKQPSGGFVSEEFCKRFSIGPDETDRGHVEYSKSTGKALIHYPAKIEIVSLTVDVPKSHRLQASFNGPRVTISCFKDILMQSFSKEEKLATIKGYDADGRRLKGLDFSSGFYKTKDGTNEWNCMFWGTPVKVDIVTVGEWIDFELPFDIPAAEKLPEEKKGQRPTNY